MFCGTCKTFTIKAITSTPTLLLYTPFLSFLHLTSPPSLQIWIPPSLSSSDPPLFLLLLISSSCFFLCEKKKKKKRSRHRSQNQFIIVEETSSSCKTMGRGKIEIKRIENSTNRQVTYSKRRAGIMKKARELTVLCDAEVSLIMFSSTGKFSEYISPAATTKRMFDRYQQVSGVSLWNSHYERMQENLNKQKEINNKLRREIRQRMGEDLDDLSIEELRGLEQNMDTSLKIVRDRKYHVITTQTETYRKKLRNLHETHNNLLREFEGRDDDPHYALANEGDYEAAVEMANGGANIFAFRLQPSQPNLHDGGGYGSHDLRLA